MRKEYKLSFDDYMYLNDLLKNKSKIFPHKFNNLTLGWIELGKKYNFDPYTVKQLDDSYYRFTAESLEND